MTLELVKTYSSSIAALVASPFFGSKPQTSDPPYDGAVLLKPARRSGARLVLLPLLPPLPPKVELPAEIWRRCLHFAMDLSNEQVTLPSAEYEYYEKCRRDLPCVSKVFKVCECAQVSKESKDTITSARPSQLQYCTFISNSEDSPHWRYSIMFSSPLTNSGTACDESPIQPRADGYNRWTSQGLLTLSPRGLPNCIPIPFSAICFVSRHYFPLWHCIQRSTSVGER